MSGERDGKGDDVQAGGSQRVVSRTVVPEEQSSSEGGRTIGKTMAWRLIGLVFVAMSTVGILLIIRFFLFFWAAPHNGLFTLIMRLTNPLVHPFARVAHTTTNNVPRGGHGINDWPAAFALVVYLGVAAILAGGLNVLRAPRMGSFRHKQ